jgi:glycyl-tRNA synthetase beta chain
MKPFLLEIGVEELPARFIQPARDSLAKLVTASLASARIGHTTLRVFGTPRRLAVLIDEIEEQQSQGVTIKWGPPAAKAFDQAGNPLPSAIGFAKSQGVQVSDLKIVKKDAADLVCVEKVETGSPVKEILPNLIADVIPRIPFQKKMRWGNGAFEFARPIRWLVCLYGTDVIPFSVAGIESGNVSQGHRFLSAGGSVEIPSPDQYIERLYQAFVVVDGEDRLAMMAAGVRSLEEEMDGKAIGDDDLMQEILYITEYPYALRGRFEEQYLQLPREVLENVMKGHQRYIPIEKTDRSGLTDSFIVFANTVPVDPKQVIRGNEKVLRARLADAQFFFEEDKRTKLAELYEKLSAVVFHERLGTLKEKVDRTRGIASFISKMLDLGKNDKIERASKLIKADLLTHMVGEFPELQGAMGQIYAQYQGEDDEVALSIREHYYPIGTDTALPESELGAIMALADKFDHLISFFAVGITPTGNLDPFALRRQTLGIIRIVINKRLLLELPKVIQWAYDGMGAIQGKTALDTVLQSLEDFITARFRFYMVEEGHNQEFVFSILPLVGKDIYDGFLRLTALETQKSLSDFQRLMVGFKRVFNITKQLSGEEPVDPSLLVDKEEKDLFQLYEENRDAFQSAMKSRSYAEALTILVGFKETIDNYFDKVFVMVEDERLKSNRLRLLTKIKDMFLTFGDFSKIRVEEITRAP